MNMNMTVYAADGNSFEFENVQPEVKDEWLYMKSKGNAQRMDGEIVAIYPKGQWLSVSVDDE